ncbi:MDR family oxidoreductase [Noviherbaspirillum massiliense]|uniref:acrylyl-CoA reductase (NADPH) n=1 Tax=Noviherbaspirillum massiliense TaxID=1465823 RepID=UPI0002EF631E|nr:MDR family oxidoreductase [Noviherbaspirillum massiliense]
MFKAILIENEQRNSPPQVVELDESRLPEGDVSVAVEYSTLNYKDALAITGKAPIVRHYPMIPGIDLAGVVRESSVPEFKAGDAVLVNGWGLGELHWGGLTQAARLKAQWLQKIPAPLTARQAMAIGTAGYTAMLCVLALEADGVTPGNGPVLVTGASGGVGSFAVALLGRLGYEVIASTGRPEEADYLKALGASEICDRAQFSSPGKPLAKERFAAAIDCIGSHTLANVCASLRYGGTVAACGMAQGLDFPASVAPFILRGITLRGVDSVYCPMDIRKQAWSRLAELVLPATIDAVLHEIGLNEAIGRAPEVLAGKIRGRLLVNVNR